MADQLAFPGFNPEPPRGPPTDRLLFAIFPDPVTAARIARLAQSLIDEHRFKRRPLAAERLHVTLHHLGDYHGLPQDLVAAAMEAAAAVAMPSFDAKFDRVASFRGRPGNQPLVLRGSDGLAALAAFQQALGAAMTQAGLGRRVDRQFTPHVTLLYNDRGFIEQAIEPIAWTAREFVLLHSLLGQTRHIPLARWPLSG